MAEERCPQRLGEADEEEEGHDVPNQVTCSQISLSLFVDLSLGRKFSVCLLAIRCNYQTRELVVTQLGVVQGCERFSNARVPKNQLI